MVAAPPAALRCATPHAAPSHPFPVYPPPFPSHPTLQDLYKPEGPRWRRNLSAIINFGKYREERLALFNGLLERAEASAARKSELEAEIAKMNEEMRALRAQRAAEAPDAARLEAELEGLFAQIQSLHHEQDQLQHEVRGLKGVHNELTDKAAARKLEVAQLTQVQQALRNSLVTSPEKLPRVLRELEENAERERQHTAASERAARDLLARLDVVQKLEKELERTMRAMEELDEAIQRKKARGVGGRSRTCVVTLALLSVDTAHSLLASL